MTLRGRYTPINYQSLADRLGPLIDLGDLGDVTYPTDPLANNDVLQWDVSTGTWQNRQDLTVEELILGNNGLHITSGLTQLIGVLVSGIQVNIADVDFQRNLLVRGDLEVLGIVRTNGIIQGNSLTLLNQSATELSVTPVYLGVTNQAGSNKFELDITGEYTGGSTGFYSIEFTTGGSVGTAVFRWKESTNPWNEGIVSQAEFYEIDEGILIGWRNSGSDVFVSGDTYSFQADASPTTVFNVDTATPMVTISSLTMGGNLAMGTNDITGAGAITASGDVTGDRLVASGTVESVFSADGDYELDNTTSSRTLSSMSRSIKYTAGTADNIPSILQGLIINPILDYTADVGAGGSDKSYAAQIQLTDTSSITQSATSKGSTETHLLRGIFGGSSLQGTYIMSAASINPYTIENIGAYFQATNTGTYNITAGAITADIIGGKFEGSQSNVTLTAGTPTFNIYGGYFSAVGTTDGTSTCYGAYISSSGADTNYGIYQASNVDNVIHGSLMVGAASAPSYTLEVNDTLGVTGVTTLDDDLVFTGSAGEGLPYAQIYEEDGTGTLALAAQDTAYQVTLFSADGESNNATTDHTNDHITIVKAGRYYVSFGVSFSQTTAVSIEYDFHVKKNNGATDFTQVSAHRNSGGASSVGSCGASGIIDVAANDTIELWVERLDGAAVTRTITIQALQLTLFQIGGT